MKALQKFTPEYLEECRSMSLTDIAQFLEDFRLITARSAGGSPLQLISMRIPMELLRAFRKKCELSGTKYQTQIKKLMVDWLAVS